MSVRAGSETSLKLSALYIQFSPYVTCFALVPA